jgi:hypothetical protein
MSHININTGAPCNCGFGERMTVRQVTAAAAWQPGQWGKGIYFPENDHLVTWGDEGRTHGDVWGDDEHGQIPGPTHHLIIRPDGTVRDQGSMDRNYQDAPSAVPELAAALKTYDPRLKLDASDGWDFGGPNTWSSQGPTEPMETEPSGSEDESRHHGDGVQTGGDFAGGL